MINGKSLLNDPEFFVLQKNLEESIRTTTVKLDSDCSPLVRSQWKEDHISIHNQFVKRVQEPSERTDAELKKLEKIVTDSKAIIDVIIGNLVRGSIFFKEGDATNKDFEITTLFYLNLKDLIAMKGTSKTLHKMVKSIEAHPNFVKNQIAILNANEMTPSELGITQDAVLSLFGKNLNEIEFFDLRGFNNLDFSDAFTNLKYLILNNDQCIVKLGDNIHIAYDPFVRLQNLVKNNTSLESIVFYNCINFLQLSRSKFNKNFKYLFFEC